MTKRRRTANPIFQQPLTKLEADPKLPPEAPKGKVITCAECGLAGGTLEKQGDEYVHADKAKCRILKLRRKK